MIPESPYYQFWVGVKRIGEDNGGDEALGLEVLKRQAIAVLRRTLYFPYIDFERLFYKALEKAVISYDPAKGAVNTHLVWQARDIAQRMVRSKKEYTKHEITQTDTEDEEGRSPVDNVGEEDIYDFHSPFRNSLRSMDYMYFRSVPKLSSHTYGELVALLHEGKERTEIAEEWGVCTASVLTCIKEVREFITSLGVQRELETETG